MPPSMPEKSFQKNCVGRVVAIRSGKQIKQVTTVGQMFFPPPRGA